MSGFSGIALCRIVHEEGFFGGWRRGGDRCRDFSIFFLMRRGGARRRWGSERWARDRCRERTTPRIGHPRCDMGGRRSVIAPQVELGSVIKDPWAVSPNLAVTDERPGRRRGFADIWRRSSPDSTY